MADKSAPAPESALARHIADRRRELTEVVRHFGAAASIAQVPAEKADAEARVAVGMVLLAALDTIPLTAPSA